ncbi:MAG: 4Fe-4S binding protein [Methanoregula sp.]|jgi:ferredoxin|nr:4Fe-4S binding protein [Methanoregula sp.]
MTIGDTLKRNKWRYLSLVAGFFLFVGPFVLLGRGVNLLIGSIAEPTIHTFCYRMPVAAIFGGGLPTILGSVAGIFVVGVVGTSFFLGPAFCGWLCPVGGISEGVSRAVPLPDRFRLRLKDPAVTRGLRYGFFAGFVTVAVLIGYKLATIGSLTCKFCTPGVLQNIASGLTGDITAITYWHTGSILTLFSWLLIGGVFMSGGRGMCLFFCPLGALSSITHTVGKKLGMYRVSFNKDKCADCKQCKVSCPTWAIGQDRAPDSALCNTCRECTTACPMGSYEYRKGGA